MDTLLKLAGFLNASGTTDASKLRPALYIAQQLSGREYYQYHLSQGIVFSDQLDQDLSQLESGGFLIRVDQPESGVTYSSASAADKAVNCIRPEEMWFRDLLIKLLEESNNVLDAAATFQVFRGKGLGDPGHRLEWFRLLAPEERERAKTLSEPEAALV